MIQINPNFNILLWILFLYLIIENVVKVIAGIAGWEKEDHYNVGDAVSGIIWLIFMFIVVIK